VQIRFVSEGHDHMLGIMHLSPGRRSGLCVRHDDGAGAAEGGQSGACVSEIGSVASGRFYDPGGWGCQAQSGDGEEGDGVGGIALRRQQDLTLRATIMGL
jgi:hypothetical protein